MDRSQLFKGVLDLAVLAVVDGGDSYGYDVVRQLRDAGLADVGDASVYGTLQRLHLNGDLAAYYVPSDTGPARKYYSLSPAGRTSLRDARARWLGVVDAVDTLLGASKGARS